MAIITMASTTGWGLNITTGAIGNDHSLNNSSGFNAFPEGIRNNNGSFYNGSVIFWSSTEFNSNNAWNRDLYYVTSNLVRFNFNLRNGFSVRFVRDYILTLDALRGCQKQPRLLQQRRKALKNNKPLTFKSGVYRNKKRLQNCSFFYWRSQICNTSPSIFVSKRPLASP